jgi:hypothetical protein
MLDKGTYRARGIEGGLGVAGTGTEQVAVRLRITEVPHEGESAVWYGYFTEKTKRRTLEALIALGWSGDDLSDLSGIDANEVEIVVDHEPDREGEMRARVKWINAPGGLGMKTQMQPADAKSFARSSAAR